MYKVMIVDDEPSIRTGLPKIIDWEAYDFSISAVARNGDDAVKKLKNDYPDLIITDIKMPILDGFGLINHIRNNLNDSKMPFIILSGYDEFEFAKRALKYNVKSFLIKPVDEEELITSLCEIREELSQDNAFPHFYQQRMENFNHNYLEIEDFKLLSEAIENNRTAEIEGLVEQIFHRFMEEKLHPNLVRIHLGNFLFKISTLVKELGGTVEDIDSKERLMAVHAGNLNAIRLKNILIEFSLNAAHYLDELKKSCRIINRVKQYVEKYYYKNLKLKDMAELLYINPAYLGQLFKKETGMLFCQYVNDKRLQNAKKLLLRTDLPIYQIAERVGYKNVDYFICKFKETENCTPLEYKNKQMKA
ncbi:MAG TPA: response regulator [Firmicutes bacterium]|jgi:two-component system response regulator YesN|nr:response regulator [Bacillota bacterium]